MGEEVQAAVAESVDEKYRVHVAQKPLVDHVGQRVECQQVDRDVFSFVGQPAGRAAAV